MYQLYSLLLTLGFIVLLPRFLFDALRHGKYVAGFSERLGFFQNLSSKKKVIWLHCVSVGETQAARPLVERLRFTFPDYSVVVSTITLTGQKLAREVFQNKAERVFYFPFDWRWSVRRALRAIDPDTVLLMETELWPNFLHECRKRNVPVALVNGRISAKSERRYRLVKKFFRSVVGNLNFAIMQTEADRERLEDLKFPSDKLFVCGNLKFDAGNMVSSTSLTEGIRQRFQLTEADDLLVAASTHAPEERILLETFQRLKTKHFKRLRMMIAPRHPERFAEVGSLIQASNMSWVKRSSPANVADREAEIILLDSIGELPAIYVLAKIVFVGGSIANFGGHNILEPAAVGSCIVTGAHTHNFQAIVKEFVEEDAIFQLAPGNDGEAAATLSTLLEKLLRQPELRDDLRKRSALLVQKNQGATECTLSHITPLLQQTGVNSNPPTESRGQ
ncbi:MAG: hypothetical protein C5B44_01825 [Acidobacteria bacterium]|nr:MAG: hypothetical protein C5B44_01825 [Acidobacteriota bacterium]